MGVRADPHGCRGRLGLAVVIEREKGVDVASGDSSVTRELRATLIFRRQNGNWKLIYRHADPLGSERRAAELFRSNQPPEGGFSTPLASPSPGEPREPALPCQEQRPNNTPLGALRQVARARLRAWPNPGQNVPETAPRS